MSDARTMAADISDLSGRLLAHETFLAALIAVIPDASLLRIVEHHQQRIAAAELALSETSSPDAALQAFEAQARALAGMVAAEMRQRGMIDRQPAH